MRTPVLGSTGIACRHPTPRQNAHRLTAFNFDLIIPGADTIWTQTIERTDEDIADLLFATPYQYTMRHRFPKPPGV